MSTIINLNEQQQAAIDAGHRLKMVGPQPANIGDVRLMLIRNSFKDAIEDCLHSGIGIVTCTNPPNHVIVRMD